MLTEELEKYFFSSSIESASPPISTHLEVAHAQLSETFLTDLIASAHLQKSQLKISKLADASITTEVKEVC